jgi:hypothetical protein
LKATLARKVSAMILVISVVLLVSTLALPDVKEPEAAQATVPPTPNPPGGYEIYGYGIPPVENGTVISVSLSGFVPGMLQYTLSPTVGNLVLTAIAYGQVGDGPTYNFSATAEGAYSLELMVVAYNGSGFSIRYMGVWSPFDFLLVYTSPAVFILLAGLAGTYYFGTRIPKQLAEEKVQRELDKEKEEANRT